MVSLAGKTLGKYRLIEQLGRGGFASVYKAYQTRLDRYVAIKVLHPHLVEGEDFLARFEREAKSVAGLRHPNIVIVHDFDVEDHIYYMVMEYIDGLSLKQRLEALNAGETYMPLAEVSRTMVDISSALDYAHQREMLHRDVKPSNVILNKMGDAFLTDFGIARILSNSQFTATGALIGTPAYMSPEQGQGLGVSPASDVYSLGVMLYEFLIGKVPFDADTPLAIIFKHIRDPLPSVHSFRADLPVGLERVVYKSLAKEPEDRFQSSGEMIQALQEALVEDLQHDTPSPDPVRPSVTPQPATLVEAESEMGVERVTPVDQTPLDEVVDPESHKGPTLMDSGEPDLHLESPPQKVAEPESAEADLAASKAPTLAVEGDSLDFLGETKIEGDGPVPSPPELGADKAPTVAIDSELEPAFESGVHQPDSDDRIAPVKSDVVKRKKRPILKYLGIAAVVLVSVILLGVVLNGVFNSGAEETPEPLVVDVIQKPTTKPTSKPKATLKSEPTEISGIAQFEHGMALLHEEGDFMEAIQRFKQAEELGFREPDLYGNLGLACLLAYHSYGECGFEQAIRYYNRAIELDPGQAGYYGGRGWAHLNIERWKDAFEDYSRAIELDPDDPEFWVNRGTILSHMGDIDAALAEVSQAVEMNPGEPRYRAARGEVFAQAGDLEAAIDEISAAIELDPENPSHWETRGWYHLEMDHPEAALADFDHAISLDPDFVMVYVGKAHAHIRLEDFDAALQDLGTGISKDLEHDGLYLERARVYWWHLGDIEMAMQDLNTAIDLNPENWEAIMNRGEIYAYEFGDTDQGLENFNRAVRTAPPGIDTPFFVRGLFYNNIENWEAAVEDLTMSIRMEPEFPDEYGHRGYAFQQLGMVGKARADYEMFLEITADNPEYEEWRREVEIWLSQNP